MTDMDRAVTRRTLRPYRITITGAHQEASGRKLVATLHGDERGDWLTLREAGRRYRIKLSIPELYAKACRADALKKKKTRKEA